MNAFLAVMAMVGMFTTAIVLSYPIDWAIQRYIVRPLNWLQDKHIEWSEYNRNSDLSN